MLNTNGDNILVCARIRPVEGDMRTCTHSENGNCVVVEPNPSSTVTSFSTSRRVVGFDAVFPNESTTLGGEEAQEEIFRAVGMPLSASVVAGYNATIFAYGQTGAGKSYTMMGFSELGASDRPEKDDIVAEGREWEERGLAPRVLEHMFGLMAEESSKQEERKEFECQCTMLEIYNENIVDLLVPASEQRNLPVREDLQNGVFVDGLSEHPVRTWREAYAILRKGLRKRTTGETQMNAQSSRSHCIFSIDIHAHVCLSQMIHL